MEKKFSIKRFILWLVGGLFGLFVILIIIGVLVGPKPKIETPAPVVVTPKPAPVEVVEEIKYVFDVPSLLGKTIEEAKAILGKPDGDTEPTAQQIQLGVTEWDKVYEKDGYSLSINYNPKTRKVIDVFFGPYSGTIDNPDSILEKGNLSKTDKKYSIKPVKAVNDSGYTGVIVK